MRFAVTGDVTVVRPGSVAFHVIAVGSYLQRYAVPLYKAHYLGESSFPCDEVAFDPPLVGSCSVLILDDEFAAILDKNIGVALGLVRSGAAPVYGFFSCLPGAGKIKPALIRIACLNGPCSQP